MRIKRMIAEPRHSPGGVLARFSVEVTPEITIQNMRLCRNAQGEFRVWSPNAEGCRAVDLAPDLVREMRALAVAYYDSLGAEAHARRTFA